MAYKQVGIIKKNWRDIKPPLGSVIDYSNPLSQGLIGCWLMQQNAPVSFPGYPDTPKIGAPNIVNPNSKLILNYNTWDARIYWRVGIKGMSLYKNNDNGGTISYDNGKVSVTNQGTIVIFFSSPVTSNYGLLGAGTSNSQRFNLNFNGGTTLTWQIHTADTVRLNATYNTNYIANTNQCIAISMNSTGNALYYQGYPTTLTYNTGSASTSGYWIYNTLFNTVYIGTDKVASTSGEYYFYEYLVYNRALSPAEIQSLYIAPYQMIAPIVRRTYIQVGGEPPVTNRLTRRKVILSCN